MDLIEKLHAFVKPKGETFWDAKWLDDLPRDNYLAAQDIVLKRLREFVSEDNPLDAESFRTLVHIDETARHNIALLSRQFVNAPALQFEVDERLWQSI